MWVARRKASRSRRPGRVDADQVAERREDVGLVEDDPVADAVGEGLDHRLGVVGEAARGVAIRPAAGVLERLRQVPVVERREGPDAGGEQRVDQPAVVVESLLVDLAPADRLDARPRDREAIAPQPEVAQDRDVLVEAVVGVAGVVAGVAVLHAPGRVGEAVPDALAAAVRGRRRPRSGRTPSRPPSGTPRERPLDPPRSPSAIVPARAAPAKRRILSGGRGTFKAPGPVRSKRGPPSAGPRGVVADAGIRRRHAAPGAPGVGAPRAARGGLRAGAARARRACGAPSTTSPTASWCRWSRSGWRCASATRGAASRRGTDARGLARAGRRLRRVPRWASASARCRSRARRSSLALAGAVLYARGAGLAAAARASRSASCSSWCRCRPSWIAPLIVRLQLFVSDVSLRILHALGVVDRARGQRAAAPERRVALRRGGVQRRHLGDHPRAARRAARLPDAARPADARAAHRGGGAARDGREPRARARDGLRRAARRRRRRDARARPTSSSASSPTRSRSGCCWRSARRSAASRRGASPAPA